MTVALLMAIPSNERRSDAALFYSNVLLEFPHVWLVLAYVPPLFVCRRMLECLAANGVARI